MADINVSTTPGNGTQATTQDPQAAGNSVGSGTPTSSVQPGTVGSLDSNTGGVPLTNPQLSTVSLAPSTAAIAKPAAPTAGHNPLATAGAIILLLVAVVLIISVFLPAKNTTE